MFGRNKVIADEKKVDEILERGVAEIIPSKDSLKGALMEGRPLRIKLGIDPTSSNIHLGRTVPLLKLRDFQELGHKVVFIVGDFTAVIGDTSDKEAERPMLSKEVINKNLQTYKKQVGKILDLNKTEFRKNSEWLEKLTYREIGQHADIFSVADFISRDNIKKRLDAGKRVSLREVLYPLMQGYDSVATSADIELGGTDQRFNVLAGRPLQEKYKQQPQHVLLFSLVTDPSGKKMSSSWGNTINILDKPNEMFGKTMRIPDELTEKYFISMTRVPLEKIKKSISGHPRDAKLTLAYELVRMYHGEVLASDAKEHFLKTFSKKETPNNPPSLETTPETLIDDLVNGGFIESKNKLRTLLENGAIRNSETGEKLNTLTDVKNKMVLKIGKRVFVKIIF